MMHEMMDLGKKESHLKTESPENPKISYPSFSMKGDKIPEAMKNMKVGDMCECKILLKKTGDSIIDTYNNNQQRVEVEIHKLGMMENKEHKDDLLKKMSKHK